MNLMLGDLLYAYILVYLDNILNYLDTAEDHTRYVGLHLRGWPSQSSMINVINVLYSY